MHRRDFVKLGTQAGMALLLSQYSNPLYAGKGLLHFDKQLGLIDAIRSNASTLGLKLNEGFYKTWQQNVANFMYYLYVAMPDKLEKPAEVDDYIYIGTNEYAATQKARIYIDKGYHTLIYKTAGSSSTDLTTILLSYPMETIAFIAFHEATHQHIRSHKVYMPYVFEEACCDVIGNYATIALAKENKHLHTHRAKKLTTSMEAIDKCIIEYREKFEKREYISAQMLYEDCSAKLKKLLPRKDKFFEDRYIYEVNNAYFLRYRNYTENYFLLKDVLMKKGLTDFVSFISTLPPNETLAKEQLIAACK